MQINVVHTERLVRVLAGLPLLSLPFWLDTPWRWPRLMGLSSRTRRTPR